MEGKVLRAPLRTWHRKDVSRDEKEGSPQPPHTSEPVTVNGLSEAGSEVCGRLGNPRQGLRRCGTGVRTSQTLCADSARLEKKAQRLNLDTFMFRSREVDPCSPRRQVALPEQAPGCTGMLKHHGEAKICAGPRSCPALPS